MGNHDQPRLLLTLAGDCCVERCREQWQRQLMHHFPSVYFSACLFAISSPFCKADKPVKRLKTLEQQPDNLLAVRYPPGCLDTDTAGELAVLNGRYDTILFRRIFLFAWRGLWGLA